MSCKQRTNANAGFTLIEILLAMTIVSLVMVSIFNIVSVGLQTFTAGTQSMEDYQSGRIAMRDVTEELRFALSPKAFWRPDDSIEQIPIEQLATRFTRPMIQERDPGAIRFIGSGDNVLFVRKRVKPSGNPPFDLEECRIFVDRHQNLVLQVERSLIMVKRATWFFQELFEVNLNGFVVPNAGPGGGNMRLREVGPHGEPPLEQFVGNYGVVDRRYLLAEDIKEITFRYNDGSSGWQQSWDSQEIIPITRVSPQSESFNPVEDMQYVEKGPPRVVEITLTLHNDDTLVTAADIPAGNMHSMQGVFFGPTGGSGGGNFGAPVNNPDNNPRNETPSNVPRAGI